MIYKSFDLMIYTLCVMICKPLGLMMYHPV